MIGIFKNNNPLALLLLALLALLPEFAGHAKVISAIPAGSTALFHYLAGIDTPLEYSNGFLAKTLKTILLLVEALLLNKIITDHKLVERPGFIPAMAFLVLNAILPYRISLAYLILVGVILLVLKMLIVMYKQSKPNNQLLLTGFIVGCLAALNSSYLLLYPWITICIMIMRPASMREWLVSSLGFLLPFYFLASGLYLADRFDPSKIFPAFALDFNMPRLQPMEWTKIILFVTLPWAGIVSFNKHIGKMMIQGRKAYLIMLLLNLSILMVCALSLSDISTTITLLLVPSTLLFAPFFLAFKRNFIPNLLLLALILLSLVH